jgi:hypothetical protein
MSQLYRLNDILNNEYKFWKKVDSIHEKDQDKLSNIIIKATEQLNNLSNLINNIPNYDNINTFPHIAEEEVVGGRKKNYRRNKSRRTRKHKI